MKISVVGLGYVGTVVAACLAREGNEVIGVDNQKHKVDMVNNGKSPIIERDIEGIISEQVAKGNLTATTDVASAMRLTDVCLICVGTPGQPDGSIDLSSVERVSEEIGTGLADHPGAPVVVLRSTVLPGTTRGIVIPALERASSLKAGADFGVAYNPEFLREGSAVNDFYNPPKTVIGELNSASGEILSTVLYRNLPGPMIRSDIDTAEMVKYADNAWHALKIGFANEVGNICKPIGIDSHKVMDIFCQDRKLNISRRYLKPGFAFGGMCLPKDLRALLSKANSIGVSTPILRAVLPSNDEQIQRAVNTVIDAGNRKVGLLGLSFKAGTDDVRESPIVELAERLIGKGYELKIFDRNVQMAKVSGANRDFILDRIPHVSRLMVAEISDVLQHAETVVIGNLDPEFKRIRTLVHDKQVVIDLVRIADARTVAGVYEGVCW